MAVKTLRLKNLSAFEDVTFELSPGINVLLGANSTGKTHVLKWLYAVLRGDAPILGMHGEGVDSEIMMGKVKRVFMPASDLVSGLLRRAEGVESGEVDIIGDEGYIPVDISLNPSGLSINGSTWGDDINIAYLPSREMLAHFEGFVAAYLKRESAFDETFFDLCVSLGESPLRAKEGDFAHDVSAKIEAILGGAVELDGGRFYVNFEKSGGARLEAQLVAEGLRKLASVARLVRTGAIAKGSLLLWDEPESGMNPRLVAAVARILGILVREGVQVVIATHDFLLAQRISLLAEAKDPIPARFFFLSREGEGKPVQVASGGTYSEIPPTPSEEEYLRLQDDQRAIYEER